MDAKVKPIPEGYRNITPYLTIKNAAAAIDFYKQAFEAKERTRMTDPGGRVGHAEIQIGDSVLMMSDEYPEMGAKGPQTLGGSPVMMHLYVEDVDAVVERAVQAGGTLERPVETQFYGDRAGLITDPFGHKWWVSTHVEDVAPEELEKRAKAAMG